MLSIEGVNLLSDFSRDCTQSDFIAIFGERLGLHLWDKFTGVWAFDLLALWGNLSSDNRAALVAFLNR